MNRRTFGKTVVGALPLIAAAPRVSAQSSRPWPGRLDLSIIRAGKQVMDSAGEALAHGMAWQQLNWEQITGAMMGGVCQLRTFTDSSPRRGVVSVPNTWPINSIDAAFTAQPPGPVVPDIAQVKASLGFISPEIERLLPEIMAPDGSSINRTMMSVVGSWGEMMNHLCGVPQYFSDLQGGYVPHAVKPQLEECDPLFPGDPCWIEPPTECAPLDFCIPDPLPGIPNPVTGVILPWADPNNPKAPSPTHLTRDQFCFWVQQLTDFWSIGVGVYGTAQKIAGQFGLPVIVTLSGEVVIESVFLPEVIGYMAAVAVVSLLIRKLACPL